MLWGNCNAKAGDLVRVAEVTDLLAFGRYGQRCDSDIQRAVRNPVQVPSLFFIANGGTSLVPTISVRLDRVCPCAFVLMPLRSSTHIMTKVSLFKKSIFSLSKINVCNNFNYTAKVELSEWNIKQLNGNYQ